MKTRMIQKKNRMAKLVILKVNLFQRRRKRKPIHLKPPRENQMKKAKVKNQIKRNQRWKMHGIQRDLNQFQLPRKLHPHPQSSKTKTTSKNIMPAKLMPNTMVYHCPFSTCKHLAYEDEAKYFEHLFTFHKLEGKK